MSMMATMMFVSFKKKKNLHAYFEVIVEMSISTNTRPGTHRERCNWKHLGGAETARRPLIRSNSL